MPILRVRVVDVPTECGPITDVRLTLQAKDLEVEGIADGDSLIFEVPFEIRTDRSGTMQPVGDPIKREGDGRRFIHLAWWGTQDGRRQMFRRIKLFFDQAPELNANTHTYEVAIRGRDNKGLPACARASVLR